MHPKLSLAGGIPARGSPPSGRCPTDHVPDNIRREQKLKELYNNLAKQNDTEAITAFFNLTWDDRIEKIKAFSKKWKEENHETFDGLWEKMKKEILTKQEN